MTTPIEIVMPKLGDTVYEGTIVRWLVEPGDQVGQGDSICEIETDKVTTDYPSEYSGVVTDLLAEVGAAVPVGEPIIRMTTDASEGSAQVAAGTENAATLRPTGAARAAAAQQGLDPRAVAGSGRHGRVRLTDVQQAARDVSTETPRECAGGPDLILPSPMRRRIAAHMQESWSASPHALVAAQVDVTDVIAWRNARRAAFRAEHGVELSLMAAYVRAVARAVDGVPDVGLAVALNGAESGLVVPVVRDAAGDWQDVAVSVADLVERARSGRLDHADLDGGSTTITNVGVFGALWCRPILNRGQHTIIGLGTAEPRPVGLSDGVRWRITMPLSLTYDRRHLDEIAASAFLRRIVTEIDAFAPTSIGGTP